MISEPREMSAKAAAASPHGQKTARTAAGPTAAMTKSDEHGGEAGHGPRQPVHPVEGQIAVAPAQALPGEQQAGGEQSRRRDIDNAPVDTRFPVAPKVPPESE